MWLVEKYLISDNDEAVFAVPNVLLTREQAMIPIANTSVVPQIIRKGDIVGQLLNPSGYFDVAKKEEHWDQMVKHAHLVSELITTMRASEESLKSSSSETSRKYAKGVR